MTMDLRVTRAAVSYYFGMYFFFMAMWDDRWYHQ